jgi:hypothetical protein
VLQLDLCRCTQLLSGVLHTQRQQRSSRRQMMAVGRRPPNHTSACCRAPGVHASLLVVLHTRPAWLPPTSAADGCCDGPYPLLLSLPSTHHRRTWGSLGTWLGVKRTLMDGSGGRGCAGAKRVPET